MVTPGVPQYYDSLINPIKDQQERVSLRIWETLMRVL